MQPSEFAAQLISRLESLKRKQDTINSLEEKLQQIREVCVTFCCRRRRCFYYWKSQLSCKLIHSF